MDPGYGVTMSGESLSRSCVARDICWKPPGFPGRAQAQGEFGRGISHSHGLRVHDDEGEAVAREDELRGAEEESRRCDVALARGVRFRLHSVRTLWAWVKTENESASASPSASAVDLPNFRGRHPTSASATCGHRPAPATAAAAAAAVTKKQNNNNNTTLRVVQT